MRGGDLRMMGDFVYSTGSSFWYSKLATDRFIFEKHPVHD
jgi:hypothetical protein